MELVQLFFSEVKSSSAEAYTKLCKEQILHQRSEEPSFSLATASRRLLNEEYLLGQSPLGHCSVSCKPSIYPRD